MEWLRKFINRRRLRYIGTVEGETAIVNREGNRIPGQTYKTYWLLYESEVGKRGYQIVGRSGEFDLSPHATRRKVEVKAWVRGGPLPSSTELSRPTNPTIRAKLIAFPGGKA